MSMAYVIHLGFLKSVAPNNEYASKIQNILNWQTPFLLFFQAFYVKSELLVVIILNLYVRQMLN